MSNTEKLGFMKVVYAEGSGASSRRIIGEVELDERFIRVSNQDGEMIIGYQALLTIKNPPKARD